MADDERQNRQPDRLTIISTLIAAAILIPLGWWLKEYDPMHWKAWLHNAFH